MNVGTTMLSRENMPAPRATAKFKSLLVSRAAPLGYRAFVRQLVPGARVLDVGCGNNSPYKIKSQRPDIHYTGIDIVNYNQTTPMLADDYRIVDAGEFAVSIRALPHSFDAIICSHNLEHCLEPAAVIDALGSVLKPGGVLYLSFPGEHTLAFPSRSGGLNYYDDPTHREPVQFEGVLGRLRAAGCEITVAEPRYRPGVLWFIGLLQEPLSRLMRRTLAATWFFYGFESVIWARKL